MHKLPNNKMQLAMAALLICGLHCSAFASLPATSAEYFTHFEPVLHAQRSLMLHEKDKTMLLLPSFAYRDEATQQWRVPVHGWVFEYEEDDSKRAALAEVFRRQAGLEPRDTQQKARYQRRANLFLVDNERREKISVQAFSSSSSQDAVDHPLSPLTQLPRTAGNGHTFMTLSLSRAPQGPVVLKVMWRKQSGHILVNPIAPHGISIISDIDDTLKITQVLQRKSMLQNTFIEQFKAAPGMAQLYGRHASRRTAFHYLSSSPFNLYPELAPFMLQEKFPAGSFHLRVFRFQLGKLIEFIQNSKGHKLSSITQLLQQFPKRSFILIGDAGEKDPEIYGEIAAAYPSRIKAIYIRKVEGADHSPARFKKAFGSFPSTRWCVAKDLRTCR